MTIVDIRKYSGSETLETRHRYAVVDGTTCYALGETEEEVMDEFRNACRESGIELGDYEVVEVNVRRRAAIRSLATGGGLQLDTAERVLDALGVTDEDDLRYIAAHPKTVTYWDDDASSDKIAGHAGWVVYWEPSDTATSVANGDPEHHEHVRDLAEAVRVASGEPDAAARIVITWDTQDPSNSGWHVQVMDSRGDYIVDSLKAWFPVSVDEYSEDESEALVEAIEEEYPSAKVELV